MKISRKKRQFFIAFVDIALLVLAVYLSLWIRDLQMPTLARFLRHIIFFVPIVAAWIVCFYTAGFYSLEIPQTGYRILSRLAIIAVICTLIGFAFFYLNYKQRIVKPKTILVIYSSVVVVLIAFWRWVFNGIAIKYIAKTNIAFVGINDTVIELLKNTRNFSYMSYKVMFLYEEKYVGDDITFPVINDPELFIGEIKKNNIQMVVIANRAKLPEATQNILFELMRNHVHFIDLPDFYEIFMRRIPLEAVNELWFLKSIDLQSKRIYRLCKRSIDVLAALMFLAITVPFWPLIMLLIKMSSPGPAFFKQERTGFLGRQFTILKFRTMRIAGNSQEPTAPYDLRVTGIGKFLRKTRIDEIPQFINIIKSDMSFIGPRPERPELIRQLEQQVPFYRQRLLVKPGLSGWDQVSGEYHSPSREDTYKKLQYDLYYIKNMSFFLDISIFFKTLVTIFKRAGV